MVAPYPSTMAVNLLPSLLARKGKMRNRSCRRSMLNPQPQKIQATIPPRTLDLLLSYLMYARSATNHSAYRVISRTFPSPRCFQ